MTELKRGKTDEELLAEEVTEDFLRRQEERRLIERGWQLNMNFVSGNQYCDIDASGEIFEEDKNYFWQARRVFNHIAPIVDLRCSKLGRIRPALIVRAASAEEKDRHSASLASAILAARSEEIDRAVSDATVWSEICGTAFYKVIWDGTAGGAVAVRQNGGKLNQGDVKITALSPFEIYPYSLKIESLEEQPSIIHAKAVSVQDIYSAYGVKLEGKTLDEISHSGGDMGAQTQKDGGFELVIERYERPTEDRKQGRLTVVAGGVLLYDGALPYKNGDNESAVYPFVKQLALPLAGAFFGTSVVSRLIPLQRAYNAVKNRKHEFLNRISMGTLAVEDGSVDTDELVEDGLTPGKIIVYRQGGTPPEMLTLGSVPSEFASEEENLLKEFSKVSGTGTITENTDGFAGITSATGLQLILEQDEERMEFSCQQIKRALTGIGRQTLRLYRQFASDVRLIKFTNSDDSLSLYYFKGSDISSDDVCLATDSETNMSPAQKRTFIYDVLDKGLLAGSDGKLTVSAKNKVLELLGFKALAGERDLSELNRSRAGEENLKLCRESVEVKAYEDHATHITEHTAFLLSEDVSPDTEMRICAHIDMHKKLKEATING
ncbi:MAG: hypothetical protein K2N23_07630 [Clostridia bacterium]|nr:hypothetical protein [Clostridia bacterium]